MTQHRPGQTSTFAYEDASIPSVWATPSDQGGSRGGLRDGAAKNSLAYQATIAEGALVSEDTSLGEMVAIFDKHKVGLGQENGYKLVRDQITLLKAHRDKEGIRSLMQNYFDMLDYEEAQQLAAETPDLLDDIEIDAQQVVAFENATAAMAGDITRIEKDAIANQYFMNTLAAIMAKEGKWEFISNTMGFILNDVNIDVSRWAKSGFWDAREVGSKMILNWKQMTLEEQVQAWPGLVKAILEATDDNERKTVATLLKFLSPTGDQELLSEGNWDLAFWGIDVATIAVAPLLRAILKTHRAGTTASKIAQRIGSDEKSADAVVMALTDDGGQMAKSLNTDRAVAATDASAIGGSAIDNTTFTANVQGKALSKLQQLEQEVGRKIAGDDLLAGELLTPAEKQLASEKYLSSFRTPHQEATARFQEVKIGDTNKQGFEILADYGTRNNGALFKSRAGAVSRAKKLQADGFFQGKAEIVEKKGGFAIRDRATVNFRFSEVGEFEGKATKGPVAAWLSSVAYHLVPFLGTKSQLLRGANFAELGGTKILADFNNALRELTKPLGSVALPGTKGRNSLNKIDQILLQGDAHQTQVGNLTTRGKVYTPQELSEGIVVPSKKGDTVVKLDTEEEIQAYYGMRRMFDLLYTLKNEGVRRTLIQNGMKNVKIAQEDVIARPFEDFQAAKGTLSRREVGTRMFDMRANDGLGGVREVIEQDVKTGYEQGMKLVRFPNARKYGDNWVELALVDGDDLAELPAKVLNYKDAYVPKIHKNGYFFAKEQIRGLLNGQPNMVVRRKTLRIFASKKAAEIFVEEQRQLRVILEEGMNVSKPGSHDDMVAKLADLGHSDDEIAELIRKVQDGEIGFPKKPLDDIRVFNDREIGIEKLDEESLGLSGGLYTSPRAQHDILFGSKGEVAERHSAFESLQRNIQHISNYFPRNEWRIGMQQRWMNTAKSVGAIDARVSNFRTARQEIKELTDKKMEAALRSAANWIDDQARIPTASEKWISSRIRELGTWAEGIPLVGQKTSLWALKFSSKDVIGLGRAAAFHALLGWFNPAQLFVQAQGASIALSLHPRHALKGLRGSFGLTSVAFIDATTPVGKKLVRAAGKSLGYDADEFLLMKNLLDESGLVTSIKQTADHAAAVQGFGHTLTALRRVADNGLFFYRRGEMFNRTYGLSTALELWKTRTGKTLKQLTKADFASVLDEAIGLNLNMFRANRAAWQRGIFSLPSQFMQIQAKWIESMLGVGALGELTGMQKTKFMMMQFALYGAAGIPTANYMANQAMSWAGLTPTEVPEATKRFLNGGVWDLALSQVLGADNRFGERGAIANDIVNNMMDIVLDEAPATGFFGAFGEIPSRGIAAIKHLLPMIANANKVDWSAKEIALVASELAEVTSTWRNATKAYMMFKTGTIVDRKGNVIIDKRREAAQEFKIGTIIGQALGFRADEEAAAQQLRRFNKHNEEIISDNVETIMNLWHKYLGGVVGEIPNPGAQENVKLMMDFYMNMLDPALRRRVRQTLRDKMINPTSVKEQQVRKWLRLSGSNYVDAILLRESGGLLTNTVLTAPDEQGEK